MEQNRYLYLYSWISLVVLKPYIFWKKKLFIYECKKYLDNAKNSKKKLEFYTAKTVNYQKN